MGDRKLAFLVFISQDSLSCIPCTYISACHWGRGCTPRSRFSPCRGGRGCTPRSCISACRGGRGCTPRSCLSAYREGRGCTPRSCLSACREGKGCTFCTSFSPSRASTALSRPYLSRNSLVSSFSRALRLVLFTLCVLRAPRSALCTRRDGDVASSTVLERPSLLAFFAKSRFRLFGGESQKVDIALGIGSHRHLRTRRWRASVRGSPGFECGWSHRRRGGDGFP